MISVHCFGICVFLYLVSRSSSESVYGCYGPPGSPCTQHRLECPVGKVIAFYKISYGRKTNPDSCAAPQAETCSTNSCCRYESDVKDVEQSIDANMADRTSVNSLCSNKQTCVVPSPYVETGTNMSALFNYVHYWFGCIPTARNYNIMDITQLTTTREFLLYFTGKERQRQGLICSCDVTSQETIRIASLYVHLSAETCRRVRLTSKNHSLFSCSDQGVTVFFQYLNITGKEIKLNVDAPALDVDDFLWLYFHSELGDLDVSCTDCQGRIQQNVSALTYRLIGGKTPREGRVEVLYNNTWGTVCDDTWGPEEETVICRHLGYNPSGTKAFFGEGTGPIWLDDIVCTGSEGSLADCKHPGWNRHNCDHREDVAVICKDVTYRLQGGSGAHEGRVEVFFNNQWGTVCDRNWGPEEARVVCKQLGFMTTRAEAKTGAHFGEGSGPIWLDNISCTGSEPSLADCQHPGWRAQNCSHVRDASVICKPASYRLVGGAVKYEGRVEVFHNNQWGTVCDDGWGINEATVTCGHLGFNPTPEKSFFGEGTGPIWLDDVKCSGEEAALADCRHSGWSKHDCDHREDVAVVCKPVSYRLVDGSGLHEGRVEVYFNNRWGTICGSGWGTEEASVVCRERGFSPAGAEAKLGYFGPGNGSIWLGDVACTGSEATIAECNHPDWTVHNCNHSQDVSVICKYGPTDMTFTSPIRLFDLDIDGKKMMNVEEGENISISCFTDCYPTCLINWYKTTADNIYSDPLPSSNGKLNIVDISRNHSGEYYCIAVNPDILGSARTKTLVVNVIYGPTDVELRLWSGIVMVEGDLKRMTIIEGQDVTVTCTADCYPTCLITWYKSTTITDPIPTVKGELAFNRVNFNQTGEYYCSVINPVIRGPVVMKPIYVGVIPGKLLK